MQKNMTLTLLHHQLHRHLKSGCSYNQISTARSMLSTLIDSNELSWGNKPIVKRFMKGLFETNPIFQNYCSIWDVSLVLNYFRKLPPPQKLSLSLRSKKLALFLTLISGGQRCQTVHAIDVKNIIVSDTELIIPIMEKIKQTKPSNHMLPLKFKGYPTESKLCVVTHLSIYLKKTKSLRKSSKLFVSYIKPHKAIIKETLARWCKNLLPNVVKI